MSSNPRRYTAAFAIRTDPCKVIQMTWCEITANGHDLIIKDKSGGNVLFERKGRAGIPQDIVINPTVFPMLYLDTIGSGTLEVTFA